MLIPVVCDLTHSHNWLRQCLLSTRSQTNPQQRWHPSFHDLITYTPKSEVSVNDTLSDRWWGLSPITDMCAIRLIKALFIWQNWKFSNIGIDFFFKDYYGPHTFCRYCAMNKACWHGQSQRLLRNEEKCSALSLHQNRGLWGKMSNMADPRSCTALNHRRKVVVFTRNRYIWTRIRKHGSQPISFSYESAWTMQVDLADGIW